MIRPAAELVKLGPQVVVFVEFFSAVGVDTGNNIVKLPTI